MRRNKRATADVAQSPRRLLLDHSSPLHIIRTRREKKVTRSSRYRRKAEMPVKSLDSIKERFKFFNAANTTSKVVTQFSQLRASARAAAILKWTVETVLHCLFVSLRQRNERQAIEAVYGTRCRILCLSDIRRLEETARVNGQKDKRCSEWNAVKITPKSH
jgi:hypothetical protein